MMGSHSLLHVGHGALSVRLSEGFLVLMAVCSVRSSCYNWLITQYILIIQPYQMNNVYIHIYGCRSREVGRPGCDYVILPSGWVEPGNWTFITCHVTEGVNIPKIYHVICEQPGRGRRPLKLKGLI